ncbi:MAG TPA: YoaK family protein [Rhodanobacteraceae bacterium]|nr:YoaK family protein [Rhodanobacteraceae bacterium]
MISRLPRWVLYGGIVLAFIAGMINAAGYLGFRHQAITHMTGTTSLLGIAAADGDAGNLLHFGMVLLAFFAGCALSGFITGDSALRLGRRYGVALATESALLFIAVPLLHRQVDAGLWLAAAASGLQNAMAGTFSGAVVRTSHVSGIVTDLGTFFGQWLRGAEVDLRRVKLYGALFSGFFCGGVASALAFPYWQERTLLAPAVLTGLVGIAYVIYRHRRGAVAIVEG